MSRYNFTYTELTFVIGSPASSAEAAAARRDAEATKARSVATISCSCAASPCRLPSKELSHSVARSVHAWR